MFKLFFKSTAFFLLLLITSCKGQSAPDTPVAKVHQEIQNNKNIRVGANQTEKYFPLLQGKRIGVVGNPTSIVTTQQGEQLHLVDTLLRSGLQVVKVFSPEHGFRGKADAGEQVKDGIDPKSGLPIISLYGSNKKPTPEQLNGIDVLLFDIQDVGVRFYTYISTLHYVMEAGAEANIPVVVLDRPNPNGHYIDGPVLEAQHQSFVGMHPVPVVHGMSTGEYAQMINGEKWLANNLKCKLTVIPVENYQKTMPYSLPVKPSPNLPNDLAINLYPSLCFFEGTQVNAGRGTSNQFQVFGSPYLDSDYFSYQYTPQPNEGAKHPKHEGKICYGKNLTQSPKLNHLKLSWLVEAYQHTADPSAFFNSFFTKLAGTKKLQQQIEQGLSAEEISDSWKKDLQAYDQMRKPYQLYD